MSAAARLVAVKKAGACTHAALIISHHRRYLYRAIEDRQGALNNRERLAGGCHGESKDDRPSFQGCQV